jgi:hypothetical protein
MSGWIIFGVWLVVAIITFFVSSLFDGNADTLDEYLGGAAAVAFFWPLTLPIGGLLSSRIALHDYIIARRKAKKLRFEEKTRIQSDQEKVLQRIERELDQELASTSFRDHITHE